MKIKNISFNARSFDIRKPIDFIKSYSTFILIFSLFASGLIIGTLSVKNSEYFRYLLRVFSTGDGQFSVLFINRIFPVVLMLTLNFIMGLCLVGTPFIYFVSVAEGIYFSAIYAYRLNIFGYDNIAEFLLSEVLFFVLLFVISALSQYSALKMSETLKNFFCNHMGTINLRNYLLKSALFLSFSVILIIIQSFVKLL